jgi:putative peptide zinc metalloprotease protein
MTQTRLSADQNPPTKWVAELQQGQSPGTEEVPERPALAPNVELVGQMQGSGFQDRQWLIQHNGRFLQVTELLYRIAEQANGQHTLEEIAAGVTAATDWLVSADQVHQILQTKLIPLGLIALADGTVAAHTQEPEHSPLQINLRKQLLGPRVIDPIARILQLLYAPPLLIPILLVIAIAHGWLYFAHGVSDSIRVALYTPGGLLLVLMVMVASGIIHEFGHAAALRYGGGQVRGMGTGLYLIYPTFYTDTTDAYRLGRWARLRTDLGGIYFHLIFTLAIIALYFITGQELLLAIVLLIDGDILYQLIPYVRLDGYWALADLTGIPDFFSQTGPFLRSILPLPASQGVKLPALKPWVKAIFVVYLMLTIPVLALLFLLMVANFPRLLLFAGDALRAQTQVFVLAQRSGDGLAMTAVASQILLLTLSMVASVYFLFSVSWKAVKRLWAWSRPTAPRRLAGMLATVGVLALVAFLWLPSLPWLNASMPSGPPETKRFEITERTHVQTPVVYSQTPPVGGNHSPLWQNCGFYATPIANEHAVHSLEHGAVWITYRPDLAPEQSDTLAQLAQHQTYVLVSPLPNLPAPVVASAWNRQLQLDAVDDPRLEAFIRTFRLGAQAPERGGGCTGGIGVPQ